MTQGELHGEARHQLETGEAEAGRPLGAGEQVERRPRRGDRDEAGGEAARTVMDVSASRLQSGTGAGTIAAILGGVILLGAIGGGAGYLFVMKKNAEEAAKLAATATPPPAVPKGSLLIESDPPGASIWVNGDLRSENTPATIDKLPVGVALDIKLTKDGFEHAKQSVSLKDGEAGKLKLDLKKGSVVVEVKVTP